MTEYARQTFALIKEHWPDAEAVTASGRCWVRLRSYPVPPGWTATASDVLFVVPDEPAQAPYGFYVPRTLMVKRNPEIVAPTSHYIREATGVPAEFNGEWSMFSWAPMQWTPQDNIVKFVRSFCERLEGLE
ncbi:MAG TPA: E2/UBC family protein [Solirubrobacteraceae bacterium]|jgi:hypothetical protein|nr:E2/UBC family protein [Solirubrobacteraceae bacterium]